MNEFLSLPLAYRYYVLEQPKDRFQQLVQDAAKRYWTGNGIDINIYYEHFKK